jgi:hypothetical protein
VWIDQTATTAGKNVVVFEDLRIRMMKPRQPEVVVWKKKVWRKCRSEWRMTSSFLIEKYARERWESVFTCLGGYKQGRQPEMGRHYNSSLQPPYMPERSVRYPDRRWRMTYLDVPA